MNAITQVFTTIASKDNRAPGDYVDGDGFLVCAKCHTRKQFEIDCPILGDGAKLPIMCECRAREREREEKEDELRRFQQRVDALRQDGLTDPEYSRWTFANDDRRDAAISDACRKYVDEWEKMRKDNVGLLFYGGVGTGKSFSACCIGNELLDRCIPTLVTSFPRILSKLQAAGWGGDRAEILDRLQRYELVVIDDLGVERGTEYALEQIFTVVDTRYRSGKPLIVTTNLSPQDIKAPNNLAYQRVYDRILQNSIPVKMAGESRRVEIAAKKREKYQGFFGS